MPSVTVSLVAMAEFVRPVPTSRSTSRSRPVSLSRPTELHGETAVSPLRYAATSRRITVGLNCISPDATALIAASSRVGSDSFSTNPAAPRRSASWTYSSRSTVVRISTRAPDATRRSSAFRRMSIRITSGCADSASNTAVSLSEVSPTTVMSGVAFSKATRPALNNGWSSTTSTRVTMPLTHVTSPR